MKLHFTTALAFLTAYVTCDPDNGWGGNINWQASLDDMKAKMKDTNKPGMLIIHKSWCGACKQLKPKFAASTKIEKLSEDFVMLNTLDDDEPSGEQFTPDGGYIPRILFLDPSTQKVVPQFKNEGRDNYKYFYTGEDDIVASMTKVKA